MYWIVFAICKINLSTILLLFNHFSFLILCAYLLRGQDDKDEDDVYRQDRNTEKLCLDLDCAMVSSP